MYDLQALYEAASVQDAVALRLAHPEAQIIAGGTDVLVQMREGKRAGKALISIHGLDEIRGISKEADGTIRIGSLASFSQITADPIIQAHINVLGEAVDMVGGPQIRNAGTIGGNTCNGVTSADSGSTLVAWDAVVELTGQNGKRLVPISQFYIKAGVVDLQPDEIQTAILIPKSAWEGYKGHYIKYAMREAMDIATIGCSVNVKLSEDKTVLEDVRIAYGVAGDENDLGNIFYYDDRQGLHWKGSVFREELGAGATLSGDQLYRIALSPDRKTLAVGTIDRMGAIYLYTL